MHVLAVVGRTASCCLAFLFSGAYTLVCACTMVAPGFAFLRCGLLDSMQPLYICSMCWVCDAATEAVSVGVGGCMHAHVWASVVDRG